MISEKISKDLKKSSWIRLMFEEGEKLTQKYGRENVYDFSLGNPNDNPPQGVLDSIVSVASAQIKGKHGYMSNAGYVDTRENISAYINATKGSKLTANHIIMTVGAAGGLNVTLKTLLDPGDEVIVFSPYFVEYLFYISNHGGKPVV
ncbi:MAG: aminotransferase class I/II-fold pyridoxal phosphate-dependent enzyme, partial [Eubacteriales bacterium]|nr:aminotransferase class I/II-fold pyridoxal phosphate-dependent enzyme [Eubacteriales bacterium]